VEDMPRSSHVLHRLKFLSIAVTSLGISDVSIKDDDGEQIMSCDKGRKDVLTQFEGVTV
jgi:hypothetical protein